MNCQEILCHAALEVLRVNYLNATAKSMDSGQPARTAQADPSRYFLLLVTSSTQARASLTQDLAVCWKKKNDFYGSYFVG